MSSHYGYEGPLAAPGWYPDGRGQTRYWNGTAWTSNTYNAAPTYNPTPAYPQPFTAPPPQVYQVSPKSPGLAVLGSFFVPGLGQLINGQVGKAITFFALWCLSLLLLVVFIGFLTTPVLWIWAMVDGYSSARLWNLRHGIIS